jgi:hypothetical protein
MLLEFVKRNAEEVVITWSHDGASLAEVSNVLAFPKFNKKCIANNPSFQVSSFPAFSNLEPKGPYHGCPPTLVVVATF